MELTLQKPTSRTVLQVPATSREVSVYGLMMPLDMLDGATVRVGIPGPEGVIAWQGISNPMERAE